MPAPPVTIAAQPADIAGGTRTETGAPRLRTGRAATTRGKGAAAGTASNAAPAPDTGPDGPARAASAPHAEPGADAPDLSRGYHYRLVARAIQAIAERAPEPAPLDALAAEAGMSPTHFQRVFSRWAGVSPKRFGQYLALGTARRLLAERRSLLDAAWSAGLSGPGRLHDLFVTWEAMTPGDYARGADRLAIAWAAAETPFGPAVAMATERGLCGLGFAGEDGIPGAFADLARRWPRARFREDAAAAAPFLDGIFEPRPGGAVRRLHLIGGPFALAVWEALLQVPAGRVTTYADLASAVGRPAAARAVGTAVGRNPVSWLVPCHRVLRREGGLGGYHWGLGAKRAMLALEAARAEGGAAGGGAVESGAVESGAVESGGTRGRGAAAWAGDLPPA